MKTWQSQMFLILIVVGSGKLKAHDLTFRLACHPDSVALQFDVSSSGTTSFGTPSLQNASPHVVESSVVGSGATRFVVYSTSGSQISSTGELLVTFSSPDLADGMLTVSGVMASDIDGQQENAAPNCKPLVIPTSTAYRSQQVGVPTTLSATAYDLDGQMVSMTFNEGGSSFSTVFTSKPATTSWTPTTSGPQDLSVTATDLVGWTTTVSLGEVRAYELADLATFADFESIHFGSAANPSNLGFSTAPFGSGIPNGLAWLLGINPNDPDRSLLPTGSVEGGDGGNEFVFRFNRLASLSGVDWEILESPDLTSSSWNPVPGTSVTETPLGDGTVDVEVRKVIDPATEPKAFLSLEVTEIP